MKNILFSVSLLLVVSAPSLFAETQALTEKDYATKVELKKADLENRKLRRTITSLEEAVKQMQTVASEDRKLIKDKFSLIQQGSIFATGILSVVLTIISIGVGLAGIVVYKIIDVQLSRKYQRKLDEGTTDIFVKIYKSLSHAFYLYYRSFSSSKDKKYKNHPGFKSANDLALWYAKGMLNFANKYDDARKDKR